MILSLLLQDITMVLSLDSYKQHRLSSDSVLIIHSKHIAMTFIMDYTNYIHEKSFFSSRLCVCRSDCYWALLFESDRFVGVFYINFDAYGVIWICRAWGCVCDSVYYSIFYHSSWFDVGFRSFAYCAHTTTAIFTFLQF